MRELREQEQLLFGPLLGAVKHLASEPEPEQAEREGPEEDGARLQAALVTGAGLAPAAGSGKASLFVLAVVLHARSETDCSVHS